MRYIILAGLMWLLGLPGWADQTTYAPDIAEFDGASTYGFSADPAFAIDADYSIEFWVAAGWSDAIGYDPVILTNGTEDRVEYVVALLEDRQGLIVLIGDDEFLVAHDFTNGKLHHVALIWQSEALAIVINGEVLDTFDLPSETIGANAVWIGSFLGNELPFIGSIGQIRFWRAALDLETLKAAALVDVTSFDVDHPELSNLVAMSAFTEDALLLIERAN